MMLKVIVKRCVLTVLALAGYLLFLPLFRAWRVRRGRESFRVLRYHSVGVGRCHETNVTPARFARQMDCLVRLRPVRGLAELVAGTDTGGQGVALTFDDGYRDNLTVAAPILHARGVGATCFVVVDYLASDACLPHDAGGPHDALLQWDDLRVLSELGVTIGSHGLSHRRFAGLASDELAAEVADSRRRLAARGWAVTSLAYPYGVRGDYDARAVAAARAAGYGLAVTAGYGWERAGCDPYRIRRIGVDGSDTRFTFAAKLNGALDLLVLVETPLGRGLVRWANRLLCRRRGGDADSATQC